MSAPDLAPLRNQPIQNRPWEGSVARKAWDYTVTVAIPHLCTPEPLAVAVELLRLQSMKPFIMIIDTGSTGRALDQVLELQADDVEVHLLRANCWRHPSDPPASAMDSAFSLCRSPWICCTHADVFVRRRDLLEDLVDVALERNAAVIGYEMTERGHPDWKGMVSHTFTLARMDVMDRIGAGWSLRRCFRFLNQEPQGPEPNGVNWPDTESCFNYCLRAAGITPELIGHEVNYERTVDANIDHCRTLTASMLYSPAYYAKAKGWLGNALYEARERIKTWKVEKHFERVAVKSFDFHGATTPTVAGQDLTRDLAALAARVEELGRVYAELAVSNAQHQLRLRKLERWNTLTARQKASELAELRKSGRLDEDQGNGNASQSRPSQGI